MKSKILLVTFLMLAIGFAWAGGQHVIPNYDTARDDFFWPRLYSTGGESLYCGVRFEEGQRITVEHVYSAQWIAERFGCEDRDCDHPSYKLAEADLHNLWPALGAINSSRGDQPFDEIEGNEATLPPSVADLDCDYERTSGSDAVVEPRDSVKGEIARSLFYMHAEYGLSLRDMLPMLKRWNEEDPPNAHERQRNDTIEELQGIRNSFIDDPTLAGSL